ncbi:MAG: type IV pilus modification PilV family protein [Fimbriiglobus sp.]
MLRSQNLHPHGRTRRGVSLTEVLVAMFVMAIGMISLMTLFPLGAMQVGQALRDDRTSQLARQADGYVRQWWRGTVVVDRFNQEHAFWTMDDPNLRERRFAAAGPVECVLFEPPLYQLPTGSSLVGIPAPQALAADRYSPLMLTDSTTYTGPPVTYLDPPYANTPPAVYVNPGNGFNTPSYPVMIDPIGFMNRRGLLNLREQIYVARYHMGLTNPPTYNGLLLPRRNFSTTTTDQAALSVASLSDDMTFGMNGAPQGGTVLGRQGRYSWSAVIQRPRNDVRNVANFWVLVYDQRPILPEPQDEYVTAPAAAVARDERRVTVTVPNRRELQPLLVKRGGYVIDGTIDASLTGRRQFIPYRISGLTETSTNSTPIAGAPLGTTTYDLDLETPLLQPLTTTSQLYFLSSLIEVFPRPALQPDLGQ